MDVGHHVCFSDLLDKINQCLRKLIGFLQLNPMTAAFDLLDCDIHQARRNMRCHFCPGYIIFIRDDDHGWNLDVQILVWDGSIFIREEASYNGFIPKSMSVMFMENCILIHTNSMVLDILPQQISDCEWRLPTQ